MRSVRVATFVLMMLTGCRRNDDAPLAPHAHPRETELSDPRAGALGPVDGDGGIEREIRHEQDAFRTHPHDAHSAITLGRLFIRKAREEEDPGWYAQANDAIRRALDLDPQNVEAAQVHALLLLQDHRFREARDAATALQVRAPTADTFAILSDANLELGDYDAAVAAAQRMIDLRPDGAAYVRVAWLRWVHGDWAGARDVMLLALDALPRSPESRAWIVTQMGVLYWNAGDRTHASRYFNQALAFDATFSAAHAGLARVALASGDPAGAVEHAQAAQRANPSAEHEWLLGDALTAAGRASDAEGHYAALERVGLRTDGRTLALYDATTQHDAVRAVELARREVENRPDVFTEDVLAWALHRAGHDAEAADAITRALRTGIHDARVLFHAGMIREARGDHDGAAAALTAALSQNPYWSMAEAEEARRALRAMGAAIPAEPLAQPDPPAHAPGPPAT